MTIYVYILILLSDDRAAVNWRSRSFKVNDFCCHRKPIYDFLLVINCHVSSISHRFRIAKSETTPPQFEPPIMRTNFEFRNQTWQAKSYGIGLHVNENCMILASAVLSQYTRVRQQTNRWQTTSYGNSGTCSANFSLQRFANEWVGS